MRRSFLGALLAWGAAGCHRRGPALAEQPIQRLEGVRLSQSTRGSPAWELQARSATLEQGDSIAVLTAPEVVFFKNKRKVSTVSSVAGVLRTDTYDVTLSTRVIVHSLDDLSTLLTEELRYSSQRKKFLTDRDVLVKRPGGTLRGRGLEASPDLSDIRIFNQRTVMEKLPQ